MITCNILYESNILYIKRIARRLKIGVEPIWFEIIPCASFYSVVKSTPEVSRMFQRNLEYIFIFYSEIINENNILCITIYSLMARAQPM